MSAMDEVVEPNLYTINGVPLNEWAALSNAERARLQRIAAAKAARIEQQPRKPRQSLREDE